MPILSKINKNRRIEAQIVPMSQPNVTARDSSYELGVFKSMDTVWLLVLLLIAIICSSSPSFVNLSCA